MVIIFAPDIDPAYKSSTKYARLIELMKLEEREGPFAVFSDFETTFDNDLHKANLEFFNQRPGLVKKIKADLDDDSVQWRLKHISHRLLYVPETRKEYIALFESYCNDVINEVLGLTEFNNPYIKIHTLGTNIPEASETAGVNAYIVHDLAKEHISTYVFSSGDQKEIAIELSGRVLLNEIGSYSSYVHINKNGSIELTRDHHTIWQNNAKNPYTVLTAPVEETLHIVLRTYTETGIKNMIFNSDVKTVTEMEDIVEDWVAIEEAIVGGLVYTLLPSLVEKHVSDLPASLIESDLATKTEFKKYRHLRKGIDIIQQLGYKQSIKMYQNDPEAFRDLLIQA
ncbi:MAG: hypothetical protein JSW20_08600 [Nitrospiraceae bacterium]|nr:MAG: hypothetical protein JSW20_08600 [Nitrospiraceae bacterium]